jgi:hypothetical protein
MRTGGVLALGFMFLGPLFAFADEVGSTSSVGEGTLSQTLSYSKRLKGSDQESPSAVSASYTLTRSEVGSTTGAGAGSYNSTHSASGTYSVSGGLRRGLTGSFTTTPAEFLRSFGVSGYLAKTFELAGRRTQKVEDEEEQEEDYIPTFGLKVTGGYMRYGQSFQRGSGNQRKGSQRKRALSVDQSIGRVSADLTASFDPFEWLGVYGSYTRYFYNRSVSDFMDALDDPRAIASGAAEFSSTLSGFSSREVEAGLDLNLPAEVTLSVSKSLATNETSGLITHSYSLDFSKVWGGKWTTGIGADRFSAGQSAQDIYNASLSYSF